MSKRMTRTIALNGHELMNMRARDFASRAKFARATDRMLGVSVVSEESIRRAETGQKIRLETWEKIAAALRLTDAERQRIEAGKANGKYALVECLRDCVQWEAQQPAEAPLNVGGIAVDLADAWSNVLTILDQCVSTDITFNMLVISDKYEDIKGITSNSQRTALAAWAKTAGASLRRVVEDLRGYRGGKGVRVIVRQYTSVPTIHGARVHKSRRRWYVTSCRDSGKSTSNFTWGDGHYWIVSDGMSDGPSRSQAALFDRHFEELWRAATQVLDLEYAVDSGAR